jgi:hypothetical protein
MTVMPIPAPKKKRTLLPLLVVVFLISYGLMTMLIVEQGGVIQQQRNLIQVLQADSMHFWALKGKEVVEQAAHAGKQSSGAAATTQAPGNKVTPSTQVPAATPAPHPQSGQQAKPHIQLPPVPAADMGDQRRVLITL